MAIPNILVVEDEPTLQNLICALLDALGANVVGVAADGIEAEKLYRDLDPDITLLDIMLPKRDGMETLEQILAFDPHARVVMLSGMEDAVVAESCLEAGARGFINKMQPPGEIRYSLIKEIEAFRQ